MIETGLQWLLSRNATIAALVGTRVYYGEAQQGAALPYVTIEQLSADHMLALDGTSGRGDLTAKDFDITCYAKTPIDAKRVAKTVKYFLSDYSGTAHIDDIEAVHLNDEQDGYSAPTDGSSIGRYWTNLEFKIQHTPGD